MPLTGRPARVPGWRRFCFGVVGEELARRVRSMMFRNMLTQVRLHSRRRSMALRL